MVTLKYVAISGRSVISEQQALLSNLETDWFVTPKTNVKMHYPANRKPGYTRKNQIRHYSSISLIHGASDCLFLGLMLQ